MIRYVPTGRQEHNLRVEYVNSDVYNHKDWTAYRDYAVNNVAGVLEAGYRGGDDPDTIEALVFDCDKNITWFIMKYS